ncbi:MAG: antibiotic biosynthesis monooxygenase [Gammaproteobacteria bacterium]|jgi:quinol monooxygenase YgiN|nr:antibiotic biosynthesis monooxygenase [Gammaproteobacteria bacterium]MBT4495019.1 antibiotic biosynthesis monooxygenase [Gammaproteobacteria bacterium]MBT7369264.1 antibiotic biosynthesis monooxygenase [Gammaproteobacteria bacterium]
MIIVHGTFPVRAEVRDDALELMRQMAVASREEDGCISYEFYVGLTDPNTLLLFQEWESVDALQGHFETDHMEDFLRVLPDVLDGEVATRRYEVKVSNDIMEAPEFEHEPVTRFEEREKIIH